MVKRGVTVILVRYAEIGLKSTPVRRRFESQLKDNMLTMLMSRGVEAFVSNADARFFVECEDVDGCVEAVRRVFGTASLSVAVTCSSDMDDICATAAEYSKGRISSGQTFAVKARREGTHPYTSIDVGREAGSAIFLANEGLKVDLTHPDKTFYVEVRNNKAYIFDEYIACPGGLPLGSQGKVVAEVDDDRGILSAWMMMKRGCKTIVSGTVDISLLKEYDPNLRITDDRDIGFRDLLGRVMGTDLDGLSSVDVTKYRVPVYFPTIGMTDAQVSDAIESIRTARF